MTEPAKRPSTRERKARSAKARLTPPTNPEAYLVQERAIKERKERAQSAKANRDKHTSSTRVFRPSENRGRFKTMYSQDFDGTFTAPAELRPTSPTRRNNPHPGKQFMVWKLPTREIGGQPLDEGLLLPPEYLARDTDFDAIEDISGGMGRLKLPPTHPTSTEYGAYLHKLPRLKPTGQKKMYHPVSNDVIERTVAGTNKDALEEWLATASPEEQHTVLKMLKSAEDAKVKQTISTVMQPEAARAVEGWMKGADNKERDVAVRLFSSLGSRQGVRQRSLSESDSSFMRPPSRKPATPSYRQPHPPGQPGRPHSRRMSAPPTRKPWPAGIWHHKPVRDPPPQVYHRGSLFGAVRGGASHFTVHPEWPDYYTPDDVVH